MTYDELSLIKQAIINEIEGYEFYRMAAAQAHTEEAQKAFQQLSDEEFMHVEWLQKLYKELSVGNSHNIHLAFVIDPPVPEIFNWSKVDRKMVSLALSVFGIGIQMEKASIEFYKEAAEKAENPALRRLYKKLIKWEENHLIQFEKQYASLKEDWWGQQGFVEL